jgi:hypothetical protein
MSDQSKIDVSGVRSSWLSAARNQPGAFGRLALRLLATLVQLDEHRHL